MVLSHVFLLTHLRLRITCPQRENGKGSLEFNPRKLSSSLSVAFDMLESHDEISFKYVWCSKTNPGAVSPATLYPRDTDATPAHLVSLDVDISNLNHMK